MKQTNSNRTTKRVSVSKIHAHIVLVKLQVEPGIVFNVVFVLSFLAPSL